ncbi:MAG: ribosomal-processing cysteine protease Prp [Aerococcus sp.]|nr:ribosomal-processing cysteine protease Prp [Aerococcus sp.]
MTRSTGKMITVQFKQNTHKEWVAMEASGHALSGEYGHDLVCAAVSTLTISLVNNIERLTGIAPIVSLDPDGGYLYMERPEGLNDNQLGIFQLLVESTYLALSEDVAGNYAEYLTVTIS